MTPGFAKSRAELPYLYYPRNDRVVINAHNFTPAWTPADISTALWLDAADATSVTTVSGDVSQWSDKSGNSKHVTQATSGSRPTYTSSGLNGRNVVTFSGAQFLAAATAADWIFLHGTTGASIFAVWKAGTVSNPGGEYFLLSTRSSGVNNGVYLLYSDAGGDNDRLRAVAYYGGASSVSNPSANGAHAANTPLQLSADFDNSAAVAASRSVMSVSGGVDIKNNTGTPTINNSNPAFPLRIGSGNGLFFLTGYVAEIVITSGVADSTTKSLMRSYLATKWGVA